MLKLIAQPLNTKMSSENYFLKKLKQFRPLGMFTFLVRI